MALASAAMGVAPGYAEEASTRTSHSTPEVASPFAIAQVANLPVERQIAWLSRAAQNGELERLSDAQLIELFRALAPDTLPRYVQTGSILYREYEFQTFSQQRVKGKWQTTPAHMLVRYRQEPRQVYAKWLPDGRNAGREIIYDEMRDPRKLYVHPGGILSLVSLWIPIDGPRAMAQSNHTVRELGIGRVTDLFLTELKKYRAAGVDTPLKIEVLNDHGERVVAFTWETPTGRPEFYARKERLGLDLRHPFFRTSESWDNDLKLLEKFSFTDVTPKHFDDSAFDPKNPEYDFR